MTPDVKLLGDCRFSVDGQPARWNVLEARYARYRLGLTDAQVAVCATAPVGPVIVGEAPGENTWDRLPMFPYPATSAGGRLLTISQLSAFDYLRSFHRVNLMGSLPSSWSVPKARAAAGGLIVRYQGHPLVLLGRQVQAAFGMLPVHGYDTGVWAQQHGCWLVSLPHPSGLNHQTNETHVRALMRRALWDAIDLWRHPLGPSTRDVCRTCGRLTQAHAPHPSDPYLRVMCPGETMRFRYPRTVVV